MTTQTTNRRSFIKVGGKVGGAFVLLRISRVRQAPIERGQFSEKDLPLARERLLGMVNDERFKAGLSTLKLDELACNVATEHARDMADGQFLSHWGSDGSKPYQRYSFAGGTDAVQENASAANNIGSLTPIAVMDDLRDIHLSMMAEVPPNDGHRKTILDPFHTHVGFGFAFFQHQLRMDQLYLARYIHLEPIARQARPGAIVALTGRLLNPTHFLQEVDVCYEPLPKPPEISWLRTARSVSLPDLHKTQRPRLPAGIQYTDGSSGDFDWGAEGKFHVRAKLFKNEPGIYTIVFWIRRVQADKAFPAAEVCIRCE